MPSNARAASNQIISHREFTSSFIRKRNLTLIKVQSDRENSLPIIFLFYDRISVYPLVKDQMELRFKVHRSDCWSDEKDNCVIVLEMEISQLPLINEKIGPYIWKEENSKNFIKKYENLAINGPYIRDNSWRVEIKRKWKSASRKLKDSLSDKENILKAKGLPTYIATEMADGFEIFTNEKISNLLKNKEFGIFLRKYFEKEKLYI